MNFRFAGIRIVGPRWSVPPPTSTTSPTWVLEMASRFRDSWIFPLLWRPQIRWDNSCHDTWHSLSPSPRLVTAAAARAPWPGLSQSRESSPCLVRARENCPRPACPPIPRLLSGPSATQRSVERESLIMAHTIYTAPITMCQARDAGGVTALTWLWPHKVTCPICLRTSRVSRCPSPVCPAPASVWALWGCPLVSRRGWRPTSRGQSCDDSENGKFTVCCVIVTLLWDKDFKS